MRATFTIAGLGGTVLPALPNTVGIVAEGPKLAYDTRSGNLRVAQGQVQAGLQYTVAAAALPDRSTTCATVTAASPAGVARFTEVPRAAAGGGRPASPRRRTPTSGTSSTSSAPTSSTT